jgi:hypothetical protein
MPTEIFVTTTITETTSVQQFNTFSNKKKTNSSSGISSISAVFKIHTISSETAKPISLIVKKQTLRQLKV